MSLVEKLFGSFSDRELKKVNPITKQVLALEPKYQAMSDADLQAQTAAFKQQLAEGKTLDDILPDAFAVCREAAWRVLGMKHFPVQVTGGIALHRGDIAEMQTGEGKTLVATLPAYLNALTGEGVHIVTVNDYLAKRDSEWMGKLYRWLGLTVGLIVQGMDGDARRDAYNADITYGTNNEFGFDYLRDNMVTYKANMVQRGHAYAIVDEVDSILIDEARTPLIISGRGEDSSSLYTQVDRFVRTLHKSVVVELEDKVSTDEQADGDYVVDEKHKTCTLTAAGIKKAEAYFKVENLAAAENMTLAHHIDQAIKAYGVMQRDMNSIHTAIESVDRAAFDQVVDRLLTASHIYLMGVRSSAFLAGYLNFYLHLMFKNVTLVQNAAAGEIFEQLSQIGPGDVLVGISFPRYSQMAIHAVEYARDRGADVVAITDGQMSPLYRMATVSLLVRSDMISFVDSMAAPLSLLNALIVAVGRQKNEEVSGTFSQLENVWSKYNIFGKTEDES